MHNCNCQRVKTLLLSGQLGGCPTDRQTDRETDRQIDRQIGRLAETELAGQPCNSALKSTWKHARAATTTAANNHNNGYNNS